MENNNSRRSFLKQTALLSTGTILGSSLLSQTFANANNCHLPPDSEV